MEAALNASLSASRSSSLLRHIPLMANHTNPNLALQALGLATAPLHPKKGVEYNREVTLQASLAINFLGPRSSTWFHLYTNPTCIKWSLR